MEIMLKFISLFLLSVFALGGSGCTYFMFWKVASYEYDDTLADRNIENLERERAERMLKNSNYRDAEINAINPDAPRRAADTRPLTIEELREQQAKEREKNK